ncbi:9332_t:CDS:2, partial [Funneliformis mosseae]
MAAFTDFDLYDDTTISFYDYNDQLFYISFSEILQLYDNDTAEDIYFHTFNYRNLYKVICTKLSVEFRELYQNKFIYYVKLQQFKQEERKNFEEQLNKDLTHYLIKNQSTQLSSKFIKGCSFVTDVENSLQYLRYIPPKQDEFYKGLQPYEGYGESSIAIAPEYFNEIENKFNKRHEGNSVMENSTINSESSNESESQSHEERMVFTPELSNKSENLQYNATVKGKNKRWKEVDIKTLLTYLKANKEK